MSVTVSVSVCVCVGLCVPVRVCIGISLYTHTLLQPNKQSSRGNSVPWIMFLKPVLMFMMSCTAR